MPPKGLLRYYRLVILDNGKTATPAYDEVWKIIWGGSTHVRATEDRLELWAGGQNLSRLLKIANTISISNFSWMLNPLSILSTMVGHWWVNTKEFDFDHKTTLKWIGGNKLFMMVLVRKTDAQGRLLA